MVLIETYCIHNTLHFTLTTRCQVYMPLMNGVTLVMGQLHATLEQMYCYSVSQENILSNWSFNTSFSVGVPTAVFLVFTSTQVLKDHCRYPNMSPQKP